MELEVIDGVVGSAHYFYIHLAQQTANRVFFCLQFFGSRIVYLFGGSAIENIGYAKVALQLEVRPVI